MYLDANENWQDFIPEKSRNRYPDPLCVALRKKIEEVMGLPFSHTVVGNGSDELIDNLIRMDIEWLTMASVPLADGFSAENFRKGRR